MKLTIEIESNDPEFNWKEEVATILQKITNVSSRGLHMRFNEPFGFKHGMFDSKGRFVGDVKFDTGVIEVPEEILVNKG